MLPPKRAFAFSISDNDDRIGANKTFVLRTCTLYELISVKASDLYGDSASQIIPQSFFDSFESSGYNKVYANGYVISYSSI